VKRAHEPLKGEWSVPGGAVNVGEALVDAIRREVREETSLDIEVGPVVEVLDRIRHDSNRRVEFHYVLIDFVCWPIGGAMRCGSDADEAVWVARDDLALYRVSEATVSVIDKALACQSAGRASRVHSE